MKDLASLRRRAIVLMREAIALLDEVGEELAAIHLQTAIDSAERVVPARAGDEVAEGEGEASAPDELTADPALVRAIGGALAMMATLMARQGGVSVEELSRLLGIYAVATRETSPDEGLIIACWGAILRDVAEAQGGNK